ncbi:MAG: Mth938-like domain-containing protein [Desulfonatronovibrionaceae bacterium]
MHIDKYSFGSMVIDGQAYHKDLKIIRDQVKPDWLRGSGHRVDISDITDILEAAPEVAVFGSGKPGLMKVLPQTRRRLESEGIQVEEMPTSKAVDRFNRLQKEGREVAAGFHLTC